MLPIQTLVQENASFALKASGFVDQICTHIWGTMIAALRPSSWAMKLQALSKGAHIMVHALRSTPW
jgi:hypothetical protein